MSPLPNGNNKINLSFEFSMMEISQVGEARRFASLLCAELNFSNTRAGRVGIVVNELGNNLVRYASAGKLVIRKSLNNAQAAIEILSLDNGPGLDTVMVMHDGFTTGTTPGTGLGAVERLADDFDIYSKVGIGAGTVIFASVSAKDRRDSTEAAYEIGAINVPVAGETVSGDGWAIREANHEIDILVADGLGHGPEANEASDGAIEVFNEEPGLPLDQLLSKVHGRLKRTRGAAVFLLASKGAAVEFAGVGNIRAVIQRPGQSKTLISQNGTAGIHIKSAKVLSEPWDGNGYLILHSDGITSHWDLANYHGIYSRHPALIASIIYRDFARGGDDMTVVVIRRNH